MDQLTELKESPTVAARITPAALATAANVNRVWVKKAQELGLLTPHSLDGEDVIVVRVLSVVNQLVWPLERRSRSESRDTDLWQANAVNTARDGVSDPAITRETTLWIMQSGSRLTHTAGQRAAFVVDDLGVQSAFAVPLGEWVATLPPGYEIPASRRLQANARQAA